MKPWLILDRDDTILDDPGYLSDPDQVRFLEGALDGLRAFTQAGWPLVVITNQSGLGRGYFRASDLEAVHSRFRELLKEESIELAGLYYCPHAPDEACDCRKPKTLLAERASEELALAAKDCIVVGDKDSDLNLGRNFGCKTVVQITAKRAPSPVADHHCESLAELAEILLGQASG